MDPSIRVENASKKYVIRHERVRSFQQITVDFLRGRRGGEEEFWALRDVSLTIDRGETFGIIGANGSGKSTLLKLIAKVIRPTSGQILSNGRIAALIELGAGFHPDLTGRENVYLHGSFLGFTRGQMRERYDRIVDFAGIADFMDTPLKHYSSGMAMRLGFATAITVDADILIVDEVLAVGDLAFQRKCLDALFEFKRRGGTILIVAQDVGTIRRFCDRALLLSHGRIAALGPSAEVIDRYVYAADDGQVSIDGEQLDREPEPEVETEADQLPAAVVAEDRHDGASPDDGPAVIRAIRVLNQHGKPVDAVISGDPIRIEIEYELRESFDRIIPGIQFVGDAEEYIYGEAAEHVAAPHWPGVHTIAVDLPAGPFVGGRVRICVGLSDAVTETGFRHAAYRNRQDAFQIIPVSREEGLVRLTTQWSVVGGDEARDPAVPHRRGAY